MRNAGVPVLATQRVYNWCVGHQGMRCVYTRPVGQVSWADQLHNAMSRLLSDIVPSLGLSLCLRVWQADVVPNICAVKLIMGRWARWGCLWHAGPWSWWWRPWWLARPGQNRWPLRQSLTRGEILSMSWRSIMPFRASIETGKYAFVIIIILTKRAGLVCLSS